MPFYHVTVASLFVGDIIAPGRHGQNYRRFLAGGPMPDNNTMIAIFWEIALESARQSAAPLKPSRLDCVFAIPSIEDARNFQRSFRAEHQSTILIVEPENPQSAYHVGDFHLLRPCGGPFVDVMASRSRDYWDDNQLKQIPELIFPCAMRVVDTAT